MTGPITWHPFTIRFVTPAFLGQDPGHVNSHPPEFPFPLASLRGALRYWLRALVGAHVGNDLKALRRVEEKVYGAAAGDSGTPSQVLLRCRGPVRRASTADQSWLGSPVSRDDLPFIGYLLGPGLWNPKDSQPRPQHRVIAPSTTVRFAVRTGGETPAALFLASLWALRTFGGLGARVRRGFGTLQLTAVPELGIDASWLGRDDPEDLTAVLAMVRDHITRIVGDVRPDDARPSYPRFDATGNWHETRHRWLFKGTSHDGLPATDAGSALAACGRLWQRYRNDSSREDEIYSQVIKRFLDRADPAQKEFTPGAYGLPVVYYDRATRKSAVVEPVVGNQSARRASPIWLRVRPERAAWQLRSLAIFAEWLPVTANLRIKGPGRHRPVTPPSADTVDRELRSWLDAP